MADPFYTCCEDGMLSQVPPTDRSGLCPACQARAHPWDSPIRERLVQLGWTPPIGAQKPVAWVHKDAIPLMLKEPGGWAHAHGECVLGTYDVPLYASPVSGVAEVRHQTEAPADADDAGIGHE